jgi:hypothetical protein
MATDFNPFNDVPWLMDATNVPVPVVDPADLKIVWALQNKIQKEHPREQVAIDVRSSCSPGADVLAIWFRLSQLFTLRMFGDSTDKSFPWLKDGKPDDAVFKVLATIPLTGMQSSGIEELIRVIQKEYGT